MGSLKDYLCLIVTFSSLYQSYNAYDCYSKEPDPYLFFDRKTSYFTVDNPDDSIFDTKGENHYGT